MISQDFLESILGLPESERLLVASRLLETLPDATTTEEINEEAYFAELERRSGDWEGAVTWAEFKASLQSEE
jgi:hypothetical protein